MTREDLIEEVKYFCSKNSYEFISCIPIGRDNLILINGDNCANKLKEFLSTLNVKHTTPCKISDKIGSYVTL